jgi:hypothetical protein
MKKMLLLFALMAVVATGAMAQAGTTYINICTDQDVASVCDYTFTETTMFDVYLYAILDTDFVTEITTAEFAWRYPDLPGTVMTIPDWNTDLIIGSVNTGIALAFNPPIDGPMAYLGYIRFLKIAGTWGDWIDGELVVPVSAADSGKLLVVDGDFTELNCLGGTFTFNCDGTCDCLPIIAVMDANWGSIKALY